MTKIEDINPHEVTDEQLHEFTGRVLDIFTEDRGLYDKTRKVIKQLGLSGMWRGCDATTLIVANLIKEVKE